MPESTPARATAVTITAAEVVILAGISGSGSEGPLNIDNPQAGTIASQLIRGVINFSPAAGTTSLTIRCRRGGLAGTQVGTSQVNVNQSAAANTQNCGFAFLDQNAPPGTTYVITGASAVANSTANEIVASVNDCQ